MRPSSGGVFEVTLNGSLIFSKKQLGRVPNDGEIVTFIEDLLKVI
jgi:selT/selW/selH-like putative selenoprotein